MMVGGMSCTGRVSACPVPHQDHTIAGANCETYHKTTFCWSSRMLALSVVSSIHDGSEGPAPVYLLAAGSPTLSRAQALVPAPPGQQGISKTIWLLQTPLVRAGAVAGPIRLPARQSCSDRLSHANLRKSQLQVQLPAMQKALQACAIWHG